MPQFDFTTYSSQIFWFSICFAALYLAMHCVVLPRITSIINGRKNVIDGDLLLAEELDKKMANIRVRTDSLRQEAGQKYQSQLDEAAKNAAKQREKSIEELKEKFDEITRKSSQELKDFIAQSQAKNEAAAQNLVQIIKAKIFS